MSATLRARLARKLDRAEAVAGDGPAKVAAAFEEFRRTVDCPLRIELEIQRMDAAEPLTVNGVYYSALARPFARRLAAVTNVRRMSRERLEARLDDILDFNRGTL